MRYRITGSDEKSRAPIEIVIDAPDEPAARRDVNARGVIIKSIAPLEPDALGAAREPVTVRIEPGHVQLIERTGKGWKAGLVFSAVIFALGSSAACWMIAREPRLLTHPSTLLWVCAGATFVGLGGLVIARLGAWWYHG